MHIQDGLHNLIGIILVDIQAAVVIHILTQNIDDNHKVCIFVQVLKCGVIGNIVFGNCEKCLQSRESLRVPSPAKSWLRAYFVDTKKQGQFPRLVTSGVQLLKEHLRVRRMVIQFEYAPVAER